LELHAGSARFGYQQQESRTNWGVGSPGAAELHTLAPLIGTSVETMVEQNEKQVQEKEIQYDV
jgi:hypothetical protein